MENIGGYIWFVGLGGALLALAAAYVYATTRKRKAGGRPNAAWEQAAGEAGDPSIAKQGSQEVRSPPRP